jgi:hypothetical protein
MQRRGLIGALSGAAVIVLGVILLASLIYFYRPDHKYRLTVEVETPQGVKSAAGVMAIYKDRISIAGIGGGVSTKGDAIFVDLGGGRNVIALVVHGKDGLDFDGMSHLALNAFASAGERVPFNEVKDLSGKVPVTGALIPTLITFTDLADPLSARELAPADIGAVLGDGYRLRDVTLETVPVGFWPFDFGGGLGEPVTRGIQAKFPWWNGPFPWLKPLNGIVFTDTRQTGFKWNKAQLERNL